MRLLFASSEVYPFSKTGGLGDVLGALPAALARLGHDVMVMSPWYGSLRSAQPLWIGDIEVPFDGGECTAGVGTLEKDGVRLAFVGHEDFRRDRIYGYPDDVRRFCRFTRSVPQVADRLRFRPDVVHVHDWHGAYLPVVLRRGRHLPDGYQDIPSVLTIHNAQYQGISEIEETLRWLRLPHVLAHSAIAREGLANALRAGSSFAERITTVSPSYAGEILTEEFGHGLDDTFRGLSHKLTGILNGIETSEWDPAHDRHLPATYDAGDTSGKRLAKRELCELTGLDDTRPLLAVVSRLAEQKGVDVLLDAAIDLVDQGWSLFVLGTGEEPLEARILALSRTDGRIAATVDYDEGLAHLVYAAADALAIPSRFEPCGLSQLIAMRYGTLPIARATGGLRDTIEHGRTGFLFSRLEPSAIAASAGEALHHYGTQRWTTMMHAAMGQDFSWDRSARRYEELYQSVTGEL
ncbi:MAG: glycogen/starch synthase [Trueperaceae bacterium]